MTPAQAAARLHLNQYQLEADEAFFREMKKHGLVAVYGGHDDFVVLQGAIFAEADAGVILLDQNGLVTNPCEEYHCEAFARIAQNASKFTCVYHKPYTHPEGFIFTYETDLPRADFVILDEGAPYCRGFVFSMKDVAGAQPTDDRSEFLGNGFHAIEEILDQRSRLGDNVTAAMILGIIADMKSGCSILEPTPTQARKAA